MRAFRRQQNKDRGQFQSSVEQGSPNSSVERGQSWGTALATLSRPHTVTPAVCYTEGGFCCVTQEPSTRCTENLTLRISRVETTCGIPTELHPAAEHPKSESSRFCREATYETSTQETDIEAAETTSEQLELGRFLHWIYPKTGTRNRSLLIAEVTLGGLNSSNLLPTTGGQEITP